MFITVYLKFRCSADWERCSSVSRSITISSDSAYLMSENMLNDELGDVEAKDDDGKETSMGDLEQEVMNNSTWLI